MSSSSDARPPAAGGEHDIEGGTFLHSTPLEIGSWRQGERFYVRRGEQSVYWRRLFSADARSANIDAADRAGRFAQAVGERDYLLACVKELLFESVRTTVGPSLPSRSECMFLFERTVEARDYVSRLGREPGAGTILELRPLEGARLFRAWTSFLDVPALIPQIVTAAEAYWGGVPPGAPVEDVEILFTGPFEIVRVVSAGAGPRLTVEGKTFADVFRATPIRRATSTERADAVAVGGSTIGGRR